MKRLLFIFALLASTSLCLAQEKMWNSGDRETLEEWVFQEQGMGRYVGISHPGLDSLTAHKQALARAWFLAVADNGIEIKMLQENFNRVYGEQDKEDQAYKYNYFAEIATNSIPDISFEICREYNSIFGEKFLEVTSTSFGDESSVKFCADSAKISAEYYTSGTEVYKLDTDMRLKLNIEVTIDGEPFSETIEILRINKKRSALHIVQGDTISTEHRGRYEYNLSDLNIATYFKDNVFPEPVNLDNGIFTAMLETMVASIVSSPYYAFKVNTVSDNVNMANKELIRMGYIGVIKLYHLKHIVNNKNIWGKWQVYTKDI